ncbi:Sec-independent protein translocase subunit TatA [Arthrobacter crystallopoietes]|jgi:sec-independent protein translocase protein TatA|uniref:Sec-independent protein translocase subunit TatA n=1 Tax=Crystallibacter crystallopoietes TaxID=37928 RepID=UPI00111128F0|nr:Sec-independent protein translocase subunit TatA [Arthrobacter crystallopoietes]QTG80163.1 Sec-independent protein translocase subunit TatA [Arthrobacter crystallopoietes]
MGRLFDNPWTIIILVIIVLLLFGAPKLPGLARSVGQSMRIFKSEVKQMKDENPSKDDADDDAVEGRVVNPPRNQNNRDQAPNANGGTPPSQQ